ncbi:MAG: hypothetical protein HKO98_07910, partial [Gemmatimonadetes bacterium]|nr:hypothetical protein [Gemmatimonadota bacterium]
AWAALAELAADAVAHRDEGLAEGTSYGYRVRACNEVGCSDWSDAVDASTSVLPPSTPTGISADAPTHDRVRVQWTPAPGSDVSQFVLERRIASAPWSERTSPPGLASSFDDTQVAASTSYSYRIRACNQAGCSGPSAIATVQTPVAPANLSVAAAYIVQRVQRTAGDVPLVAGVDGLLRVFPVADRAGLPATPVRVDFVRAGAVVQTTTIPGPGTSMPTTIDESTLSASWNLPVPASLLQPGLSLRVTVDPDAQVTEGDESDNQWPNSGPLNLDIRATPDFAVTFVPVRQTATGNVGDVGPHNADSYLDTSRRTLPFAGDDVQFHAEFVSDQPALESDGSNWSAVLSEVAALRAAEGSARAYYGVVSPGYGGGVAGIGYIGWEIALGWDRSSSRGSIAAHEWGHNFGRRHSPGCGAGNPDASYPHAAGRIGAWGYDAAAGSLKSPDTHFDFMTYCGPEWISDYVFERILDHRGPAPSAPSGGAAASSTAASSSTAVAASGPPVDGLLVWGRVSDGELVLEPAFEVRAPALLPSAPGRLRLEGRTDAGVAFSLSFDPVAVADGGVNEGHFAFVVPLDRARGTLRSLRLSDGARQTGHARPAQQIPGPGTGPDLRIAALDGTRAEVTWDRTRHPMALVRDAETGQVLAFARGGRVAVAPAGSRLEVTLSDGLGSSDTRTARWR